MIKHFSVSIFLLLLLIVVGVSVGVAFSHVLPSRTIPISLSSSLVTPQSPQVTPAPTPLPTVRMLFGGDLMFDRTIRLRMEKSGVEFILSPLSSVFAQYDVVVANLEGPVTTFPSRSVGSAVGSTNNFIFTFDPKILPMLKQHRFTIVNIGNNHIGNFGSEGIQQTKAHLERGGIAYFGYTGQESTPSARVHLEERGGRRFAYVGMNQFIQNGFTAGLEDVGYARSRADVVIVYPHWGNEYQSRANQVIIDQAHQLIDAGADLIIGAHPHVIQQSEVYKNKTIYYSLGNFVFDQYFSKETQQGLLLDVEFLPDHQIRTKEIPIRLLPTGQTVLE